MYVSVYVCVHACLLVYVCVCLFLPAFLCVVLHVCFGLCLCICFCVVPRRIVNKKTLDVLPYFPPLCHLCVKCVGLARNITYTVYIRCSWQGNHQTYGLVWCLYMVLANNYAYTCCLHCIITWSQVAETERAAAKQAAAEASQVAETKRVWRYV